MSADRELLELVETAARAAVERSGVMLDRSAVKRAIKDTIESVRDLPAIPITEYDQATCITAGELRRMGFPVPDTIPDVGWVPRWAMAMNAVPASTDADIEQGIICMDVTLGFKVPFNWIELRAVVSKEGGRFES